MVKIEVINKGRQPLPAYATAQSAGMDLRANIDAQIVGRIEEGERSLLIKSEYGEFEY